MTEIAIIKIGFVAVVGIAFEAVIDPSVTSITLAVIAGAVVIIPLWFKYKTDTIMAKMKDHDAKIETVEKAVDGVTEKLVLATGKAERALGEIEGVNKAEVKAALITAAKASGAADEAARAHKE